MRVSVFGLGYVGCVSAACLARDGHEVIGVDVNPTKVDAINAGRSPVKEPGLDELTRHMVESARLRAQTSASRAIGDTDASLICVGTPSSPNGSLNSEFVRRVASDIGTGLAATSDYHTVIVRSTVLPGTVEGEVLPILEECSGRRAGADFGLSMNPEFLREGTALRDYENPGQIVIGELDTRSGDTVAGLYQGIDAPLTRTGIGTAEMVKYATNAFHAVKITFANEIGNLCKAYDIDGREVMDALIQDHRLNISPAYLKPGYAFGGSCLPKDLRALLYRGKQEDVESPMLAATLASNTMQIERAIRMVERTGRKRVGVVGLSFKAGTDDVRESPSVPLIETLVGRGYTVSVYDEHLQIGELVGANKAFIDQEIPHIASLMRPSLAALVDECDVVVVTSVAPAYARVVELIRHDQVLVDLAGIAPAPNRNGGSYEGICW